jgi:hypothetical protein
MPTISKTFRLPEQSVDQITDLLGHYRAEPRIGDPPDQTDVVIVAIANLHAAVCRPAAAAETVTRTRNRKERS